MDSHRFAEIFPLIEGDAFAELAADIKAQGLREPIVVYENRILDGRNRYRACVAAGIEPIFTDYEGNDPVGFVISLNLRRRHLSESQRAIVAAKLATLRDGQRADLVEGLPIGRASALLNVGERTVARAREVLEHGAPELKHAVEKGEVSVSAAADVATLPERDQSEIVARGEREILRAASEIRARKAEVRHGQRIAKLLGNAPLIQDRKYPVVYADPAWKYELYRPDANGRLAAQHYPVMTTADIVVASRGGPRDTRCRPVSVDDLPATARGTRGPRSVGF
jgi:ParB-like nuclease domain